MKKTWFIADTHFGHATILKYEDRPFRSWHSRVWSWQLPTLKGWPDIDLMNQTLIDNWNDTVADGDIVWHLGDVALVPKPQIISILAQLKGHKHLVCGNHDKRITCTWWRNHGFEIVVKYPDVAYVHTEDLGYVLLSHVPVPNTEILNIHGHMHANKHRTMPDGDPSLYRCVSVEQTGFRPVSLEEIIGYNKKGE